MRGHWGTLRGSLDSQYTEAQLLLSKIIMVVMIPYTLTILLPALCRLHILKAKQSRDEKTGRARKLKCTSSTYYLFAYPYYNKYNTVREIKL